MALATKAGVVYTGRKGFKPKEFRKIIKEELQGLVKMWWRRFLPMHFKPGAEHKYHYKKRSRRYQSKKASLTGRVTPLVKTGRMRIAVTRSVAISGSSKKARGTLTAPVYLDTHDPSQPDKAKEMTTMTKGEVTMMAKWLDRRLQMIHDRDKRKEIVR